MKLFLLTFLLLNAWSGAFIPSMEMIRAMYQKAAGDETACKELISLLEPFSEKKHALLSGYKGSATMMMANYVFNPVSKLSYFNKGKKILEKAIEGERENAELRFLRYTIQTNIPFFLGYKKDIKGDKRFLLACLKNIDNSPLKAMISGYLKEYGNLTLEEKQSLP